MEIVKQGERILLRDGKVAVNASCCCECPPDQTCGPECCKKDETCCDEQVCCTQEQTCCSGVCCTQEQTCCSGSCCDTVCCDGVCCPPGQVCCGGVCCDPAKCCNGTCCPPDQSCRSGQCSPCNCPETQECCGSTDGDPDVCCDYGQCCGDECCKPGEVCCVRYNENWEFVSQQCCPTAKCCDGVCCGEDEECINGTCLEKCGECVAFTVPTQELPPSQCDPATVATQSITVPDGCTWVQITGVADDEIAIDGVLINGPLGCAFAGAVNYGFSASGSFEISLIDNYGVVYYADLKICFFTETPPP